MTQGVTEDFTDILRDIQPQAPRWKQEHFMNHVRHGGHLRKQEVWSSQFQEHKDLRRLSSDIRDWKQRFFDVLESAEIPPALKF